MLVIPFVVFMVFVLGYSLFGLQNTCLHVNEEYYASSLIRLRSTKYHSLPCAETDLALQDSWDYLGNAPELRAPSLISRTRSHAT